jgi:hypothetical protein
MYYFLIILYFKLFIIILLFIYICIRIMKYYITLVFRSFMKNVFKFFKLKNTSIYLKLMFLFDHKMNSIDQISTMQINMRKLRKFFIITRVSETNVSVLFYLIFI